MTSSNHWSSCWAHNGKLIGYSSKVCTSAGTNLTTNTLTEIFLSFFQYIHPSRKDTKQLGEMVFGTAPIANQADCLKVNINSFKKSSSAIVFR